MCISFLLHIGIIVLPKSITESRIIQNLKSAEIVFTDGELQRLKGLNKDLRLFTAEKIANLPVEEIWDIKWDEEYKI